MYANQLQRHLLITQNGKLRTVVSRVRRENVVPRFCVR